MAGNESNRQFEQMMELADFGARRNEEGTQLVFKVFVSYSTFLVLTAGFIMKYGSKAVETWETWAVVVSSVVAIGVLLRMCCVYRNWLQTVYKGLIYSVRRRDFYLKKAEILCYHSSEKLAWKFSPSEDVIVYLGSGNHRKTKEKRLFEEERSPDIENCIPRCKVQCARPNKEPKHKDDKYFQFNLWFPLLLTIFNASALLVILLWSVARC